MLINIEVFELHNLLFVKVYFSFKNVYWIKLFNIGFILTFLVSNVLKKCHNVPDINYLFCNFNQPLIFRCVSCTDYRCRKSAVAPPPSCYKFLRFGHRHMDRWIEVEIMKELLGVSSCQLKHEFLMEIGVLFSCDRHYTWIAHRMAWIFSDMFFPTTRSVHHFMTNNNDVDLNLVFCCTSCSCKQKWRTEFHGRRKIRFLWYCDLLSFSDGVFWTLHISHCSFWHTSPNTF